MSLIPSIFRHKGVQAVTALSAFITLLPLATFAFCGFYVAKADTQLFNQASKVVLARHDNKTVITMVNDYEGDLNEFAMVVPVPTVLKREQIHVTDNAIVDHLDAYTAPRLVEYFDSNPCQRYEIMEDTMVMRSAAPMPKGASIQKRANSLGVQIEAEYTVGEYDILILSAKESGGLQTWLNENGYNVPPKARQVLGSYVKQGIKFFVAKINLDEQAKTGSTFLRPLQVAFESPKFMLPIRLGTINAKGPQDLFILALTKDGRIETTNYRTVKLPTGMDVPLFVKDEFGEFYKDMFTEQVKKNNMTSVILEYAWNMNWCDPCAADPLSKKELQELGVFWNRPNFETPDTQPWLRRPNRPMPTRRFAPSGGAQQVFVTRLHVRYDAEHFPQDLQFQETKDKSNFQGRYVLRHPYNGEETCQARTEYEKGLPARFEKEAQNLARLTGWDINTIRSKMDSHGQSFSVRQTEPKPWYQWLWGK